MKLHGLPRPHRVAHRDHARLRVGSNDVADEEIAAAERVAVFGGGTAHVERRSHELSVGGVEFAVGLPQPLGGRSSSELDDQILLGLGHHHRLPDRAAALRDHGTDADAASDDEPHRTGILRSRAEDERVAARLRPAARHAADDWHARMLLLHSGDEGIDGKRERVGDQEQRGVVGPGGVEIVGPTDEHAAVGRLPVVERHSPNPGTGQAGQPDDDRRHPLKLLPAAEHALGGGTDERGCRNEVGERFERRTDRRAVGARREYDRDVGGAIIASEFGTGGSGGLANGSAEVGLRGGSASAPWRGQRHVTISAKDETASWSNIPPGSRLPGRTARAVAMPAVRAASSSAPTSLTNRICRGSSLMSAAIAA